MPISWTLKSTAATSFTIENNWESLPGDAPLLPFLMNINSEKKAGKIGGKVWVSSSESRLNAQNFREKVVESINHRPTYQVPLIQHNATVPMSYMCS